MTATPTKAERLYAAWHQRPPDGSKQVKVRVGLGRVLGTATEILYRSDKWQKDHTEQRYVHAFESAVRVQEGRPAAAKTAAILGHVEYLDLRTPDGRDLTLRFTGRGGRKLPILAGSQMGGKAALLIIDGKDSWTLRGGRLAIRDVGICG